MKQILVESTHLDIFKSSFKIKIQQSIYEFAHKFQPHKQTFIIMTSNFANTNK
jgi:hypothetical protein